MSEKNKSKASKKWLISRMKTSGSKRRWAQSGDYADTRHSKKQNDFENLPNHESMSKSPQFYNGKINTGLLKRFLRTQVGNDWDTVYSEILERIPTKLLDYKDAILWYVADKVEIRADKIWDLRSNHFIETNTEDHYYFKKHYKYMEFYVDPHTNELIRIGDFKSRKATRDLDKEALRKFREDEKLAQLKLKQSKKNDEQQIDKLNQILKETK